MAWKAVLFDMDGVLIDSEEYMAKTGVRALKKYGIDAKESDFAEFVGCGENRYVGGVAEKYGFRNQLSFARRSCAWNCRISASSGHNAESFPDRQRRPASWAL